LNCRIFELMQSHDSAVCRTYLMRLNEGEQANHPFAIGRDWRNLRVRTVHRGVPLRRSATPLNHQPFEDSEWQSDAFAAEFLMPVDLFSA